MKNELSISKLFGDSWGLFKSNWKLALIVTVLVLVIQALFNGFGYQVDPVTSVATGSLLVTGIGMIVSLILGIGTIDIFLGLTRGENRKVQELVTTVTVRKFFVYLVASILYGIMAFIGFVLLIIPGLIVMTIFLPFVYFIVDKNAGILDSLKMAAAATKGNRVNVFLVFICISILNIIGALLLMVGLLVTIPLTMFVMALMYRTLIGDMDGAEVMEAVEVEEKMEADKTESE